MTTFRPLRENLDKSHLTILRQMKRGARVIPMPNMNSGQMFRLTRGRTVWATFLLDELRQAKMLTADNQLTAEGELWLLTNS